MLIVSQKTNGRVLPQPVPLESPAVDNPGQGRNRLENTADSQQTRGETNGVANPLATRKDSSESIQTEGVTPHSHVFVLDQHHKPLMPTCPARARELLAKGRARVHLMVPFTIRIVDRLVENSTLQPIWIKLDPGSVTTGFAIVRVDTDSTIQYVVHLAELVHRGWAISKALKQRAGYRGRRRSANLRYRKPRFSNRTKPKGWLPPSILHRVTVDANLVARYRKLLPITGIQMEDCRFDPQKLENPEITGIEYQRGTLEGTEVREYLLERDNRTCQYCGIQNVPLNLDHIVAKSRGGSDRPSNLVCCCVPCNKAKDNLPIEQFLKKKPEVLARIKSQVKKSLRDAAAMNATRYALKDRLQATGLPVAGWSGGRTKWNRGQLGIPKSHCLDALAVGQIDQAIGWESHAVLKIKAMGRGQYRRTLVTSSGFPRGYLTRQKQIQGFQTGDMVRAVVPKGKNKGTHVGRIAIKATGYFNIKTRDGTLQGIGAKYCQLIQRSTGYAYD